MRKGMLCRVRAIAFAAMALVGVASAATLRGDAPTSAVVLEAGRYALRETHRHHPARDTTAGYNSVIDAELVDDDGRVPLRLGEIFGFRFAISDAGQGGEWVPVEIRITHPPLLNHRGEPSRGFVMPGAARLQPDGQYHNAAWYRLSQPHELAAGEWEIALVYRGQVLARRVFELQPVAEPSRRLDLAAAAEGR